jgi:CHAT domain/SIR2-like domain
MTQYAELEISLERQDSDSFAGDLRFTLPDSEADQRGKAENLRFAIDELHQLADDAAAYGRRLGQDFLTFPGVREVLAVVQSKGVDLRFRLSISPNDKDLQALRWETLADPDAPQPGAPLLMSERVLFSRYVDSRDWRHIAPRAKGDLRALVVVANPSDLDTSKLAPIDVAGEIKRAHDGMVGISKIDVLGESDRATKANIVDHLNTGPDIFYVVCHGALIDGKSMLWLEDDAGKAERVDGATVVSWLSELKQPPRLVVLISCQSAGTGHVDTAVVPTTVEDDALGALGPRLGSAGVPAVLAMHGNVTMATVEAFMPKFFSELQKDGLVDRAVALARGAVRDRPDAWAPVLYMRLKRGSLWSQSGFASNESGQPYEGWPALLNNINASKCTPILGAGITESLIGPRREIARRWAKTYRFPLAPHDQDDLPQVAQFVYVNQKDRQLLLDELRDSVRAGLLSQLGNDVPQELGNAPNDVLLLELGKRRWASNTDEPHWVLAQAPFPVFVTTALDGLLAEALKAVGKDPRQELFRWNDDEGWPPLLKDTEPDYVPTPEKPLVYHLFGRLGVDHSLVITEDDYFDYLIGATKNRDQIPHFVRASLAETALLFLGFEMDGWDFRVLFRSIMTQPVQLSRRKRIAHAGVQIDLVEGQILEVDRAREYLQSYFEDSNIHIYWGSVEDFSRELRQQRGNKP